MKNIKELTKIANKLDSLGLTKEADVLDAYIRKNAKPALGDFSPPEKIQRLMTIWLNYAPFPGLGSIIGYDERNDSAYVEGIGALCQYISDMADKDGTQRTGLSSWYHENIESANIFVGKEDRFHQLITKDLYELADDIDAIIKEYGSNSRRQSLSMYKGITTKIRATASKWSSSYGREGESVEKKPRPGSAAERGGLHAPTGGTQSLEAGKTYPPYTEPKSNLTGWDKYMAKAGVGGPEVKKSWDRYTSSKAAKGLWNSSFNSFAKWYGDNLKVLWNGKNKSPQQVISILNELATSDILN